MLIKASLIVASLSLGVLCHEHPTKTQTGAAETSTGASKAAISAVPGSDEPVDTKPVLPAKPEHSDKAKLIPATQPQTTEEKMAVDIMNSVTVNVDVKIQIAMQILQSQGYIVKTTDDKCVPPVTTPPQHEVPADPKTENHDGNGSGGGSFSGSFNGSVSGTFKGGVSYKTTHEGDEGENPNPQPSVLPPSGDLPKSEDPASCFTLEAQGDGLESAADAVKLDVTFHLDGDKLIDQKDRTCGSDSESSQFVCAAADQAPSGFVSSPFSIAADQTLAFNGGSDFFACQDTTPTPVSSDVTESSPPAGSPPAGSGSQTSQTKLPTSVNTFKLYTKKISGECLNVKFAIKTADCDKKRLPKSGGASHSIVMPSTIVIALIMAVSTRLLF